MPTDQQQVWPARTDWRARVVVENADPAAGYAMERLLSGEAFDVRYCGGPDHLQHHDCPLVTEGRCSLVAGADVVVHSLNLDRDDHAAVLRRIREVHPDTPVVVEVPTPVMEKHADLLDGFTLVPMPATRTALLDAVRHALSGA